MKTATRVFLLTLSTAVLWITKGVDKRFDIFSSKFECQRTFLKTI